MIRAEVGSRSFLEVVAGAQHVTISSAEAKAVVANSRVPIAGNATGESVSEAAAAVKSPAGKKKPQMRGAEKSSDMHTRLLALVRGQLRNRQAQKEAHAAQEAAKKAAEDAKKKAQLRSLLLLPPSRKHATRVREELVPHPVQNMEGHTVVYPVNDFDLWAVMSQVKGWSLPLGEAPVRGGDMVARAAEEFSVVCGFSAAFGPLLLNHATTKVYGTTFFRNVKQLPPEHLSHMFATYWEREVAPFDSTERFFRLVSNSRRGGIGRRELQPFLLAIADRHPQLNMITADERSVFIDTVLAVVFYKHSRCGVIRLPDLRDGDFVASVEAAGKMEGMPFETSNYWSVARHYQMREDYNYLCGQGWTVHQSGLRDYCQGRGRAVSPIRARRVIDAGLRPFPTGESPGCILSQGGGHGQAIDFDAFVCFCLCEEALRTQTCSERDIRYCFALVDETGKGRIGTQDIVPFYKDATWERLAAVGEAPSLSVIYDIASKYFDSFGVERKREYVTLQDMIKPGNVRRAGRFFEEIFAGTEFGAQCYVNATPHQPCGDYYGGSDNTSRQELSSATTSVSISPGSEVYPQEVLEFERELAALYVNDEI